MSFKPARNCFILAVIAIVSLHTFFGLSLAWLALPCAVFLALTIHGSAAIQSNFHAQAYCHGDASEKQIALSFDDGPNPTYTPRVLSALAQYDARATFFVIGRNIPGNEHILKQIDNSGHSIGNHSYSHSVFIDFKTQRGLKNELRQTSESVFNIIGKRMRLFRPPYGVITPSLAKASSLLNYYIIGWSVRSFDTTNDSEQTITKRVQTQIEPGAIVLFHDTSDKTIQVLKQTLNFAKENGYKLVTVEQLLKIRAYD